LDRHQSSAVYYRPARRWGKQFRPLIRNKGARVCDPQQLRLQPSLSANLTRLLLTMSSDWAAQSRQRQGGSWVAKTPGLARIATMNRFSLLVGRDSVEPWNRVRPGKSGLDRSLALPVEAGSWVKVRGETVAA